MLFFITCIHKLYNNISYIHATFYFSTMHLIMLDYIFTFQTATNGKYKIITYNTAD